MRRADSGQAPRQYLFDPTPEIFATDASGTFAFSLAVEGADRIETAGFEEMRFVASIWHPSENRTIDLDRAYVELRVCLDPEEDHWIKLAEIEPVVPPHGTDAFDGWLVLPVLASETAFALFGSGFDPRARLQIRTSAYLVY